MNHRRTEPTCEYSPLALLDVIFLVTVFCVIGLNQAVILRGVTVTPPEVAQARELKLDDFITLGVDAQGKFYVEGEQAPGCEDVLRLLRGRNAEAQTTILVNGDQAATLGATVPLIHYLRSNGYANVFCRVTEKGQSTVPHKRGQPKDPEA